MNVIKAILADDQRIFIEGLKTVFQQRMSPRIEVTGVAFDGEQLLELIRRQPADLLILDLNLPKHDGLEILDMLCRSGKGIRKLVLSRYDEPKIVKSAFKAGVDGYILKDRTVEELFAAIRDIMAGHTFVGDGVSFHESRPRRRNGRPNGLVPSFQDTFVRKYHLTKREMEILRLITDALSNKEIAKTLFISDQTVSVHRKNIMRKLGVSNTAALIKTAFENSLV